MAQSKLQLRCLQCSHAYPASFAQQWGKSPETLGYGPKPSCVQMIESPDVLGSHEVCGGELYPETA